MKLFDLNERVAVITGGNAGGCERCAEDRKHGADIDDLAAAAILHVLPPRKIP